MLKITLQETRVYQKAKEEGREEVRQQERSLILRQLTRKVGPLPKKLTTRLAKLSIFLYCCQLHLILV